MTSRRRIGYAKLGRSMPLSLDKCGSNGGDVEMVPTLKVLAKRHPEVDFYLVGRNTGELPQVVDLPENVVNPWCTWRPQLRELINNAGLNHPNLAIDEHFKLLQFMRSLTHDTFMSLDGIIMWVGQHGTSNTPLPSIQKPGTFTKPYDWATLYGSYLLQGINAWRDVDPINREEVLLNADPRNVVKYRDSKWPWRHPVLSQYDVTNRVKHERYGDGMRLFDEFAESDTYDMRGWGQTLNAHLGAINNGAIWTSRTHSAYSRLEISGLLPGTPFADTIRHSDSFDRPHDFGIVFNETKPDVALDRSRKFILKNWVLPLRPGFIAGKWSEKTLKQLNLDVPIYPVDVKDYFRLLTTARCTLTTPSSGSGWATAKPWECFAAGVVCFFHPAYDDQNHILADAPAVLQTWLRVRTAADLRDRVKYMRDNPGFWTEIVWLQKLHFDNAVKEPRYLTEIEMRLEL